jgi:membrane fusion protein, copper/silver efflux system
MFEHPIDAVVYRGGFMNKTLKMILVGATVVALAIIVYFAFFSSSQEKSAPAASSGQLVSGHQGHDGSVPAQPEQSSETDKETEEPPTIDIDSAKRQLIGVKIATAEVKEIEKTIKTVGVVEYDERRLATVNTKFEGWIEKLYADFAGKYVRKGEPLVDIYSPELTATQQEFLGLLKWEKSASSSKNQEIGGMLSKDSSAIVAGARQRLKLWDISDKQISRIEQTGKPIRALTLYSPVSGFVVQKPLRGQKVAAGEKLFDIADLSTVWIVSDIFENEIPFVKVGGKAMIRLNYSPGQEIAAAVDYVYPSLSGDTRSSKVRFTVPNTSGKLKPQMRATVEIRIPLGRKLVVPEDAVIDSGRRQIVYVDKGEGSFEPRNVSVGAKADGMIEITAGLKAGDRVASSSTFLIDSEARLKGIVK